METDALHEVVAEFSVTGNEKILVDGRIVFERRSWKLRNEHAFPLGAGHSGRLTVAATLKSATCRLFVHGREVPPHDGPAERPIQFKAPLGSNLAAVIGGVLGLMVVEMNAAQWFPHRGRGINWSRAIWAGIATGAGAGLFQLIWMLIRAAAGKR